MASPLDRPSLAWMIKPLEHLCEEPSAGEVRAEWTYVFGEDVQSLHHGAAVQIPGQHAVDGQLHNLVRADMKNKSCHVVS